MEPGIDLIAGHNVYSGTDPVRRQVARILKARQLAKARQLGLLLQFLVDHTLHSYTDAIKEYSIGVQVLGRGVSFDPATDNIVRVEVRRLRAKLDEYYEAEGWLDQIRIFIPKGNYIPRFIYRTMSLTAPLGRSVGGHRVSEPIAEAPDGVLFRAVDEKLNRDSWVWLSNRIEDETARQAAISFAQGAAKISHPGICPIRGVGELSDHIYLIFEAPFGSLLNETLQFSALSLDETIQIVDGISGALEVVHNMGFCWGSIRPQYVVINASGANEPVLLLTAVNPSTAPDDSERSPEQRAGEPATVRSDVWSIGLLLERMLRSALPTHRDPHVASAGADETAARRISDLEQIAVRCLENNPARRYENIQRLRVGLNAFAPKHRAVLPFAAAHTARQRLSGREVELAQLQDSYDAALAGERQMILISGEAGIGKTALVETFVDSLPPSPDLRVTVGHCIRIGGLQEPYYALLEALGQLGFDDLPARLATQAPTLAVQFPRMFSPSERERLLTETRAATPVRMLREICDFLELISQTTTLIVILEDIHWADTATLDFISAAARRSQAARLMIVCTFRASAGASNSNPLTNIRELRGSTRCRRMDLKPLDRTAIREVLSRALGEQSISEGLLDRLAVYTGGNPLFLRSVVQHRLESATIARENEEWSRGRFKVSEDLRQFLHGQFLDMAAEDRTLLEYASVAGSAFTGHTLAPLLNTDSAAADALYEALAATCFWLKCAGTEPISASTVTLRFEFRHGLYKDIVYRNVGRARRGLMHRALAENIENSFAGLAAERAPELAWRYEECGAIDRALHYLELAGHQAIGRFAPREAARMFDRARLLSLRCPDLRRRAEDMSRLVPLLANAYALSGEPGKICDLWDELIELSLAAGCHELAASAALAGSFTNLAIDHASGIRNAERAVKLCANSNDPTLLAQARLQELSSRLSCDRWDSGEAAEALRIAGYLRCSGSQACSARARLMEAVVHLYQSNYEGALNAAVNTSFLASGQNKVPFFEGAQAHLLVSLCVLGRWNRFLTESDNVRERHELNGNIAGRARFEIVLALLCLECFDFDRVLAICDSIDSTVAQWPWYADAILGLRAWAHAGLGQTAHALRASESSPPDTRRYMYLTCRWMLLHARTEALLLQGCFDRAMQSAEVLIQFAMTTEERIWQSRGYQLAARVHLARGAVAPASQAIESALQSIASLDVPAASWRALAIAAAVCDHNGRHDQAALHRRQSLSMVRTLVEELKTAPDLAATFESGALALLKKGATAKSVQSGKG